MKKQLLFLIYLLVSYSNCEAQVPDSIVHVSGRIFNGASNEYSANTEIWVGQSYKIVTNDTGFFELNYNRAAYFPSGNTLNLNVKNCDGWWKHFSISLSSNFNNDFNNIVLTICDSALNNTPNEPAVLSPIGGNLYEIITNVAYNNYQIDEEFGFPFLFNEIIIFEIDEGVKRLRLYDIDDNLISDNFVVAGIEESQIPCNFVLNLYAINTTNLGVYAYNYRKGNPSAEFSWTSNGIPITVENGYMNVPTAGVNNICLTASIANTCELQKCSTITVLPATQLCNAAFQIGYQTGTTIVPLYEELNVYSSDNADSMVITVNGYSESYGIIEERNINLQKTTGNEICLKIYRDDCIDESCQIVNGSAQPAPAGCIVPLSLYLGGFSKNILYARTSGNIVANSFSWNFGDGTIVNEPSVKHTYTQSGTYYVTLTTVFNECTATSYDTVIVDMGYGCNLTFDVFKYSENRCTLGSSVISGNLQNQNIDFNWLLNSEIITESRAYINYQFPESIIYDACLQYEVPNLCIANVCKTIDLSSDTFFLKVNLQDFELNTDFSDSKLVLYEFITNTGQVPVQIDEDFELGFAIRDSIDIDSNGIGVFSNIFKGYYGVKFIPGPSIIDTTILPSYTDNQLLWDQMKINTVFGTINYYSNTNIQKRTLTDNLGTGLVIGNVNYGPFKLSRDVNPLQGANLILMYKNNPVRFLALNGNTNFQLSNLSNGAYTLMLDLPGYKTSTANFVISDEIQTANVSLNYDAIAFDDFTPPIGTSIESQQINEVVLYPNPTNERLYLSNVSGNGTLKITDISGKNVSSPQFQMTENTLSIDVSAIQAGIYFLTYSNNKEGKVFKKFIKN